MENNRIKYDGKTIALIGILSAISTVLIYIGFPILPGASNLELDFSDVPALLAGVGISPVAGVLVILIKNILNIALGGGAHMLWGAFQNFICGTALVLPCSLLVRIMNKKMKVLDKLPFSMVISSLCQMLVAVLTNYFIMIPLYKNFLAVPVPEYMFLVVVFNVIKNFTVCLIFYFIYKYLYPKIRTKLYY